MAAISARALESTDRRLTLALSRNVQDIRDAQRLRYRVFAEEMGACVPGREQGVDCDIYDAHCHHVVVRDTASNEVVGTYRILGGAQSRRLGGFYSDEHFDMSRLSALRDAAVEVGRACVHPAYRTGATLALLWSGVGTYMLQYGYQYLLGSASISVADGGRHALAVYRHLSERCLTGDDHRVYPLRPLEVAAPVGTGEAAIPSLIKGYLRMGAELCGAPAWDPLFNTADLLLLLSLRDMHPRYAQRFFNAR